MLRFSLEVIRIDKITNEYVRGTAEVEWLEDKVRAAKLRCCGPAQRIVDILEKRC